MSKKISGRIEVERKKRTPQGVQHVIMMNLPKGALDASYNLFFATIYSMLRPIKGSHLTFSNLEEENLITVMVPARIADADFDNLYITFESTAYETGLMQEQQVPRAHLRVVK